MAENKTLTDEEIDPVICRREGGVMVITINRPSRRNAVNAEVATLIGDTLEQAQQDLSVGGVVITGNDGCFCAGADLKERAAGRSVRARGHDAWGFAGLTRHLVDMPLIAAVEGPAVGGGMELVLACDLAVAGDTASFALPEVSRGLVAAEGGLVRLPARLPYALAAELVLTGRPIDAQTALSNGLVNRVVAAGTALEVALGLAEEISTNAPLAVRQSKRMLRLSAQRGDMPGTAEREDLWAVNDEGARAVFASEDAAEGRIAFLERRPPVWRGL